MYTEQQLREAMIFASSHLSSIQGIDKYIDSLKEAVSKPLTEDDDYNKNAFGFSIDKY